MKPIKGHIIYYWIDDDEMAVWITAVIDERMNQEKQLKEMKRCRGQQPPRKLNELRLLS